MLNGKCKLQILCNTKTVFGIWLCGAATYFLLSVRMQSITLPELSRKIITSSYPSWTNTIFSPTSLHVRPITYVSSKVINDNVFNVMRVHNQSLSYDNPSSIDTMSSTYFSHEAALPTQVPTIASPEDFFRYLKTPKGFCKKLVSLGGERHCDGSRDGHKLICGDILPESLTSCLVYSYGVHYDISFDRAAAMLGCTVHMFDITSYGHTLEPRLIFHKEGVHNIASIVHFDTHNFTLRMNTVGGHMLDYGHLGQDLHILKVDIEGSEWDVFKELVKSPLLDYVGQIALEIHLDDLIPMSSSQALRTLQSRAEILSALEVRDFVRLAYWDNPYSPTVRSPDGSILHTCGEGLYINKKWSRKSQRISVTNLIHHYRMQPQPIYVDGNFAGEPPPLN